THTLTQITVVGLVCDGLVEVRHGSGHGAVLGDDRQHGDTGRVDLGAQRVECGQLALHGRKTVLGELAVHVSHVLEARAQRAGQVAGEVAFLLQLLTQLLRASLRVCVVGDVDRAGRAFPPELVGQLHDEYTHLGTVLDVSVGDRGRHTLV